MCSNGKGGIYHWTTRQFAIGTFSSASVRLHCVYGSTEACYLCIFCLFLVLLRRVYVWCATTLRLQTKNCVFKQKTSTYHHGWRSSHSLTLALPMLNTHKHLYTLRGDATTKTTTLDEDVYRSLSYARSFYVYIYMYI